MSEGPRGVAIIGMACRFPGAPDIDAFWRNLAGGVDSIRHFTAEELIAAGVAEATLARPDYVRAAPVIEDFDRFDAGFFEYSPREARLMDPQQRLLLQEAWRAMEDAGLPPGRRDLRVGAFMGSGGVVTSYLLAHPGLHDSPTGSVGHLANDKDFVSTKLSYKLGLTGPSINVQTACSTSLVATHLACQSILDGECDVALAGAATVRTPHLAGYLHRAGDIMSPDGRCRAYDAAAEGTVFGSGVGVVVLKHVEDALADGDRIYAVILGSAVNNDGGEKLSYTASSTDGQARAMAAAFAAADAAPASIGLVEGHGTGTVVGDPLEVEALRRCFATDPDIRPGGCLLGSVKTNIGHLEQTAGVASLIKAALALHHGAAPPSLNFETPNPRIDFAGGPFRVPTALTPWPDGPGPRRAAVNALGLGGTNAFAILEQGPAAPVEAAPAAPPAHLLLLSAKSEAALGRLADLWRARLGGMSDAEAAQASAAAARRRVALDRRVAVAADDPAALAAALAGAAERAVAADEGRKVAFLFPGQGAQYPGMARGLYRGEPAFRAAFDRIAAHFGDKAGLDIGGLVYGPEDAAALAETGVLQPALFAVEAALAEMLESWGLRPHAVLGHSVGAYAAMAVAGVHAVEAAADLIAARAREMAALPPGGAMAAIMAGEDETRALLDGLPGVGIAALNSPVNTVISGEAAAVEEAMRRAEAAGGAARRLEVSHAFHSALMAPAEAPFAAFAAAHAGAAPRIAFVSDMTGARAEGPPAGADLAAHIRRPVRFADGLRALADLGCTDFLEVGPGAALRGFVAATLPGAAVHGLLDRKGGDGPAAARAALGALWARGVDVDLSRLWPDARMPDRAPPLYPFDRTRYWLEGGAAAPADEGLIGPALRLPGAERHHQTRLSAETRPWLPDHRVYGEVTLPATAALIGLARAGAAALGGPAELRNLTYQAAIVLAEGETRLLDTAIVMAEGRARAVMRGQPADAAEGADWTEHLSAELGPAAAAPVAVAALDEIRARCGDEIAVADYYAALGRIGLNYGPVFRGVRALRLGAGEALARVALPSDAPHAGDPLHPALLDACLHLFPAVSGLYGRFGADEVVGDETFLPITVERFRILADPPAEVWAHAALRPGERPEEGRYALDIRVHDAAGAPVALIEGLTVKRLARDEVLPRARPAAADWLYGVDWTPLAALEAPAGAAEGEGGWLIVAEPDGEAAPLVAALSALGRAAAPMTPDALLAGAPPPLDGPVAGVVLATALSAPPLMTRTPDQLAADAARQFAVAQAALRLVDEGLRDRSGAPRLWILTRGAQAPDDEHLGGEAMQAVLWGHGRVAALEHPGAWGGLIDIDHQTGFDAVAAELLAPDGEGEVALRGGRRHAPRLARRTAEDAGAAPPIRAEGAYLVTGGLGVLGLKVAEMLAAGGAGRIWLVSRRTPDAATAARLAALGAPVEVVSADIAEAAEVEALMARIAAEGPPLDGVYHCAGLLDDGIMREMSWEKYHRVTRAKIEGGWALHRATSGMKLGHFVLFSSILSVIGSMGQLNYVAGNAFLDALVAHRRRLGLPAVAMNWGPWEDAGLATESGERGRQIWRARGTDYIPAAEGMEAMRLTLAAGLDHAVVTLTDWSRFVAQFAKAPPLYRNLAAGGGAGGARAALDRGALLSDLAGADRAARVEALIAALGEICRVHLELEAPPARDVSLRNLGLDSLLSITVINDVEAALGVRLEARALLRGPTLEELAALTLAALDLPEAKGGPADAPAARPAPPRPAIAAGGSWLVTRRPRPEARMRLFCFPFAGGGSAVFDDWGDAFDPSIEIVAVEPPGRLGRINEEPVRTVETFARGLMAELSDRLDRPYAVLGHCLGGLTAYETLRFIEARGRPMPAHLFVSGARPPSVLRAPGDFESELESRLQRFSAYRAGRPGYEQSDEVMAEIVRAFGISDSARMLEEAELRELILPTVRAEFEMAARYVYLPEGPFDVPITCFRGAQDEYFRPIDARMWRNFTRRRFELFTRDTGHFAIVEDFDFIRQKIEERLRAACATAA